MWPADAAREITPLASGVDGVEVGLAIDRPLLLDEADLLLTSDEWSDLLSRRRAAGRPLHLVEAVGGPDHDGDQMARAQAHVERVQTGQMALPADGVWIAHAPHDAVRRFAAATMKRAAFRGAA